PRMYLPTKHPGSETTCLAVDERTEGVNAAGEGSYHQASPAGRLVAQTAPERKDFMTPVTLRAILASLHSALRLRRTRAVGRLRGSKLLPQLEWLEERAVPAAVGGLQVDPGSWDPDSILVRFRSDAGPAAAVAGTRLGRDLSLVPGLRSVRLDSGVDVA